MSDCLVDVANEFRGQMLMGGRGERVRGKKCSDPVTWGDDGDGRDIQHGSAATL